MSPCARLAAEFCGSTMLLVAVVGSGIMAENLAQGQMALALLANSLATGASIYVLVSCLAPISGAHFNPAVSLVAWLSGQLSGAEFLLYVLVQVLGAVMGVGLAHLMFAEPLLQFASKQRVGFPLLLSEWLATFALLMAIKLSSRFRPDSTPKVVACYITGAYWFTASTSFANPAVTLARCLTDSFAGISATSVPPFIAAQVLGAVSFFFAARISGNLPKA